MKVRNLAHNLAYCAGKLLIAKNWLKQRKLKLDEATQIYIYIIKIKMSSDMPNRSIKQWDKH